MSHFSSKERRPRHPFAFFSITFLFFHLFFACPLHAQTDYTSSIVNHNFDGQCFAGWQQMGMWLQTNSDFTGKSNSVYVERWVGTPANLPDTYIKQTLSGLPKGRYSLTVSAQHIKQGSSVNATGAVIFADWQTTSVTTAGDYTLTFDLLTDNVTIGFKCENSTANWMACDNFRLTYVSNDVSYQRTGLDNLLTQASTLASQVMDSEVKNTLDGAISTARSLTSNGNASDIQAAATALKNAMLTAERSIFATKTSTTGTVPIVTTQHRYARGSTMIFGRINVSSSAAILEQGLCYSTTNSTPTVADERTTRFVSNGGNIYCIDNTTPGTLYYVRAYAVTTGYKVGYGDVIRVYTLPKGNITWSYGYEGDEGQDQRISQAVEGGMTYWNNLTSIKGFHLSAHYAWGVGAGGGTAECSYGGWMSISQSEAYQYTGTVLHEGGHGIGVGTTGTYYGDIRSNGNTGIWYGKRATQFLQFWDNSDGVRLTGDATHLWSTNAAQSLSYTINGAHEDNHTDVQYYGNALLMQAIVEDGLYPVANQLQGLAYTFEHTDDAVYYIRNSDESYGLKSSYLVDNGGKLELKQLSLEEVKMAANNAQWTLTFDPAKQLYRIKNKNSGRYIHYNLGNTVNGFRTNSNTATELDLRLQLSFVDVTVGNSISPLTLDCYHIMRGNAEAAPQALCAKTATSTGSTAFSNTNSATAQRWLILTEDDLNKVNQAIMAEGETESQDPAADAEGYDITTAMAPYLCTGSLKEWTNDGMVANYNAGSAPYSNAADGARVDFPFIERWVSSANGGKLPNSSLAQTITELPNGKYYIRASFIAVNQSSPSTDVSGVTFWAGDKEVAVSTGNEMPERYSLLVEVTDGTLEYGLRAVDTNANWIALDNISLIFCGTKEEYLAKATACHPVRVPMDNPTFDQWNLDGWTQNGQWQTMNATYDHFNPPFAEWWVNSAAMSDRSLTQSLTLKKGYYSLQAAVEAVRQDQPSLQVSGVSLRMDDASVECHTSDGKPELFFVNNMLEDGEHTIGLYVESANTNWVATDNFVLRYYGPYAPLQGDNNHDGQITITDVTLLVNCILNFDSDEIDLCIADMNGDGEINVTDVTLLVNRILNLTR